MIRKLLAVLLTCFVILAAGWLALRRPDVPYDTLETAYSLPESKFETVAGVKVHFVDTGPRDAPAVILVHGFASSLHTWESWRNGLDDAYRVIAVDLPGHGLSRVPENETISTAYYVETVDALADELDLDSFTIAGSSMGGGVAWNYALDHPDRTDGLILVDAAGWDRSGDDESSSPVIFKLLRYPAARALMKDLDLSTLVEDGLKKSFVDQRFVTEEMIDRYSALSRGPGHRGALLQLSASGPDQRKASREILSRLRVPTLILWGEQDNLIPVSHASRFEDAIPSAVAIVYENTGHIPQEEQASKSVEDVRAFLDTRISTIGPDEPFEGDADMAGGTTTPTATGGGQRPR